MKRVVRYKKKSLYVAFALLFGGAFLLALGALAVDWMGLSAVEDNDVADALETILPGYSGSFWLRPLLYGLFLAGVSLFFLARELHSLAAFGSGVLADDVESNSDLEKFFAAFCCAIALLLMTFASFLFGVHTQISWVLISVSAFLLTTGLLVSELAQSKG